MEESQYYFIISLTPGREVSTEYEHWWPLPGKEFSANRESANSSAYFAIAKPANFLGEPVRKSQIGKVLVINP
jgi:hypothetical protein